MNNKMITAGLLETKSGHFLWNERGIWNLLGEMATRKFHLIYLHWTVAALLFLTLIVLISRAGKNTFGPLASLPKTLKVSYFLYVGVVGLTFFNLPILTHGMLRWGIQNHMMAMAWSIVMAAIPVAGIAIWVHMKKIRVDKKTLNYSLLLLQTHTVMAVIYIFLGITAIE